MVATGLAPSPAAAAPDSPDVAESPPPRSEDLPGALHAGSAPIITVRGGAEAERTVSVSWQPEVRVPANSTSITIDAMVSTEQAEDRSFAVLHDGVGPDLGASRTTEDDIVTVHTAAGRPTAVRLSVEAPAEGTSVSLGWADASETEWQPVPETRLSTPSASDSGTRAGLACGAPLPGDRDHDLIPDDLERDGYAVVDSTIVPWQDGLAARGYARYVSDPNHCRSARDPYTDLEKVFAVLPGGTRNEARDPLVAAAPAVGVDLEKLFVTLNDVTSDSTARTRSLSTTNSWSRTLGGKVGVDGGVSKEGGDAKPKAEVKVSTEFNFSYTRSHSVTEGSSTSWQEMVTRSESKAASVNGNVRYHNAGSAPVFDAHPTTSWVLQDERTIASFRAGPNFRADALGAGESYPARGSAPLSVETINDAGTVDLTVTASELEELGRTGEVSLETPQTSGTYGRMVSGTLDPAAGQWGPVLTAVRESSATLVLDAGPDTAQRHVAAPDLRDPDDSTPRLSLGVAIDKAFAVEKIDGRRYYRSPDTSSPTNRNPLLLDELSVLLTMDEATSAAIEDQRQDGRSIYDVELRRGMHIGIKPADSYSDFDTGDFSGWSGHAAAPGTVRPAGAGGISWTKGGLTAGHRYRLSYRSRHAPDGSSTPMWVTDATTGVLLDVAATRHTLDLNRTFVEFTAAGPTIVFDGHAEVDDVALFSLGADRRADVTWTSRHGEDLRIPDTGVPIDTQVDVPDRYGNLALDLVLKRDDEIVDLTKGLVRIAGASVGPWSTSTHYKGRGHVNLPVTGQGASTVTVFAPRQASTTECGTCFDPVAVISISVGASRPATVSFYYKEGVSKHMCTLRFRALETPGYRGNLSEAFNFKNSSNSCQNDDAYYLRYQNLPLGTELSVFDSPDGSRSDDFFIWETTKASSGLLLLDPRERPADVTVQENFYHNGLQGKVSRAALEYPGIW